MTEGNLLVLDWDFWFPNPMEWGHGDYPPMYDWSHAENQMMINHIWPTRAASFIYNGLPLPRMDPSWRTFAAERLNIAPHAEVLVHESNSAAAADNITGHGYEEVWLFDAHHDLYKYESLDEWEKSHQGVYEVFCEDWMFVHAYYGSHLEWRYPATHDVWREAQFSGSWKPPEGVDLHWEADDGEPIPVEFDQVFICRSGAWVPPWCDDEFEQFVDTFADWNVIIDDSAQKRPFGMEEAMDYAEKSKLLMESL